MRLPKFWRHGPCVALVGLLVIAAPPAMAVSLLGPSPQDDCAIGSVTRERYREIAAEVETLPPIPWVRVVAAATSGPNPVLTEYFRGALESTADLDTKLATLHAILRRSGAEFTSVLASPNAPLPESSQELRQIFYNYNIDTWLTGSWRPVCRSARVVVQLSNEAAATGQPRLDFRDAALIVPSCSKSFSFYEPPAPSCMRSPSEALESLRSGIGGQARG